MALGYRGEESLFCVEPSIYIETSDFKPANTTPIVNTQHLFDNTLSKQKIVKGF